MKLAQTDYDNSQTGCCALIDPAVWEAKEFHWQNQPFAKGRVHALFHIPLDFGPVITRLHAQVEAAEAYPQQVFALSDENSLWGADLYLATDRDVTGADMTHLSGDYLTRVFEGPYRNAPKWRDEMVQWLAERGQSADQILFYYTACPKCAKLFGKNYVVLFARLSDSAQG